MMAQKNDDIPTVTPTHKPHNKESLTQDQLDFIQAVLDKSCIDDVCISRSKLYTDIKSRLGLKIEKYQFEQSITIAIKTKKIKGFAIKRGAYGGICREGTIKPTIKSKKTICTVIIPGYKSIKFKANEKDIIKVFTELFDAEPDANGKWFINNHSYKLPSTVLDLKKIIEFLINNTRW